MKSATKLISELAKIIKPISHFKDARKAKAANYRLELLRQAAINFRHNMRGQPQAHFYRSMELIQVPYPTKYAFLNCNVLPSRLIHILNRLFIVQVNKPVDLKALLRSPSDANRNAKPPYFKPLSDSSGPCKALGQKFVAPQSSTVESYLKQLSLKPEQINVISYDHLNTQDMRRWLGGDGELEHTSS